MVHHHPIAIGGVWQMIQALRYRRVVRVAMLVEPAQLEAPSDVVVAIAKPLQRELSIVSAF